MASVFLLGPQVEASNQAFLPVKWSTHYAHHQAFSLTGLGSVLTSSQSVCTSTHTSLLCLQVDRTGARSQDSQVLSMALSHQLVQTTLTPD